MKHKYIKEKRFYPVDDWGEHEEEVEVCKKCGHQKGIILPYPIAVETLKNVVLRLENLTTKEHLMETANEEGKLIFELANLSEGYFNEESCPIEPHEISILLPRRFKPNLKKGIYRIK